MACKLSDVVYSELRDTQKLSFTGENFLIWKLKISFVLTDYHLIHLLNPSPDDPKWNEENSKAKFLILGTLDDSLLLEYGRLPTPASIMDSLLKWFNSNLLLSRINMLRRYKRHRMAVNGHINQHIFRMRAMAKELEYAGIKIADETQAVVLLNSLPDDWDEDLEETLRDFDGCNEKLSFDNVSRRLRNASDVRKWREFSSGQKLKKKFKGNCYNCGRRGHYQSDCPDQGSSKHKSSPENVTYPDASATLTEMIYPQLKTRFRITYEGSKFSFWKGQLYTVLECNQVVYVLKEPKPSEPTDLTSEEEAHLYKKWQEDDFTCRHLILGGLEDDLFLSFHDYPTAKSLMDALEAFFSSPSTARKLMLLSRYMNHHMSDDTPTIDHVFKMDKMAWKAAETGITIPEEMQAVALLDSLPESWEDTLVSLTTNLTLDKENGLNLDNVRGRVRDAGRLKELIAQNDDAVHHDHSNRKKKMVFRGKCYSCGRPGHYQSNCPDQGKC